MYYIPVLRINRSNCYMYIKMYLTINLQTSSSSYISLILCMFNYIRSFFSLVISSSFQTAGFKDTKLLIFGTLALIILCNCKNYDQKLSGLQLLSIEHIIFPWWINSRIFFYAQKLRCMYFHWTLQSIAFGFDIPTYVFYALPFNLNILILSCMAVRFVIARNTEAILTPFISCEAHKCLLIWR